MRSWVHTNKDLFERDVLQDFCKASQLLFEQFDRFDEIRTVSFPVLRAMVGEPQNKGLLWRLKDKAHHVLRLDDSACTAGCMLDWTLGYIFHEALKLMEDAHQQQYYIPVLTDFADGATPESEVAEMLRELVDIQGQTFESMRREVLRLQTLLRHARKLFTLYFAGSSRHRPLARFLNDNELLVRQVFQDDYTSFLQAIYGDSPETLHLEAARSLWDSARKAAALDALEAALQVNPLNQEAIELRQAYAG